jgi:phosphoglycolate phosphatase
MAFEMPAGTLLFDLDGTLVDSAGDLAGSLDSLMAEKNLQPIGILATRTLIGHGIANLVRGALKLRGGCGSDEEVAQDLKRFMEIYGERLTQLTSAYPDVLETLAELHSQGWQMGVCTNKREKFARAIVSNLGMDRFFRFVSGPDTFGVSKPDPLQLTRTAEAVGGGWPILFVGDSEVDVAAARAAGYPMIALSYGYSKISLASLAPEALIDHFREIPDVVNAILQRK